MSHTKVSRVLLAAWHQRLHLLSPQLTCNALHTDFSQTCVKSDAQSFHSSAAHHDRIYPLKKFDKTEQEKRLLLRSSILFENMTQKAKDKETFHLAIDRYLRRESVYRRGHVEFMEASMEKMKEFGVHKDLDTYKKLLELFPEEKMIPQSDWQVELMHYPKQQQTAIDLMDKMEQEGVIPDEDFGQKLSLVFGIKAHAFRKYRRMMYWMPKFKNLNPYPLPSKIPEDIMLQAVVALKRMAVDVENRISVWKMNEDEEEDSNIEETFIASAMSPNQEELINKHPLDEPVYVEGGFMTWIRDKSLTYFILRSNSDTYTPKEKDEKDEDLFNWKLFFEDETPTDLVPKPSMHDQEDGIVLGMCITGTGSKDSLVAWIRYLQERNPKLEKIPVVFTLSSPESGLQVQDENKENKSVNIVKNKIY